MADIEEVLREHRQASGHYGQSSVWRDYACTCGWWSTADRGDAHRAHLAAALREAGIGDMAQAWDEGCRAAEQYYKRVVRAQPGMAIGPAPTNPHRRGGDDG